MLRKMEKEINKDVTKNIVKFILKTKYENFPNNVIKKAKLIILDSIANQMAATTFPIGNIIRDYINDFRGDGESTVIGLDRKVPCEIAAWANSTLAHALDIDSGEIRGVNVHPSCKSLPVSLAICEHLGASGKDLLTAFILSDEIQIKIGTIVYPSHRKRGYHPTGTIGVFGSCTAAGKLFGLCEEKFLYAFGIAGSMVGSLGVNIGSMTKSLHAGNAAQQGVKAVLLAQKGWKSNNNIIGARGGFCETLSDEYFSNIGSTIISKKMIITILNLGNPWEIESPGIYFKAYPSCGYLQSGIELAVKMSKKYEINNNQIEEISLGVDATCLDFCQLAGGGEIAKDGYQARYNMSAGVAIGLSRRSAGIDDFTDEIIQSQQIIELMKKTRMYLDPEIAGKGYINGGRIIKIKMKDGTQYTDTIGIDCNLAEKGPIYRLSEEKVIEKYRNLAKRMLNRREIERLYELITNLEKLDNVKVITDVIRGK